MGNCGSGGSHYLGCSGYAHMIIVMIIVTKKSFPHLPTQSIFCPLPSIWRVVINHDNIEFHLVRVYNRGSI